MELIKTLVLFFVTAVAEIAGCFLPYLWLKHDKSPWLLLPAAGCLVLFVWLLTLHPQAVGRVYAAYGSVYICVALFWLWKVESVQPVWSDFVGVAVCLTGACIILLGPRSV